MLSTTVRSSVGRSTPSRHSWFALLLGLATSAALLSFVPAAATPKAVTVAARSFDVVSMSTVVPPSPVISPKAAPTTARTNPTPASAPQRGDTGAAAFLTCVRLRESQGNYRAVNPSGAAGAYQIMPATGRAVALRAGRPDLARLPVSSWSPYEQDAMARALYVWQGAAPWGGAC